MPSGGFLSAKKASKNKIMRIYYKINVFACFRKKHFVVYHDQGHDQAHDHDLDHDLDHDKQQSFSLKNTQMHQFCNKYALFCFLTPFFTSSGQ